MLLIDPKNKKALYFFLSLSLVFLFLYYLAQYYHEKTHSPDSEFSHFSQQFDIQSIKLADVGRQVSQIIDLHPNNLWDHLDSLFKNSYYTCFVTTNDSVLYWNSNKTALDSFNELISDNNTHVIKLQSGWYLYNAGKSDKINIYILELIKTGFQVNNDLLSSGFNPVFSSCPDMTLTLNDKLADYTIYNDACQVLLCANINPKGYLHNADNYSIFLLILFSFIFFLLFLLQLIYYSILYRKSPLLAFTVFVLIIVGFRFLSIYFGFPYELKSSSLFTNYTIYTPFAKSFGDMIINIILLVVVSVAAFRLLKKVDAPLSPYKIIILYTAIWLYILLITYVLYQTIYGQNISFFSESIFRNKALLGAALIIIGLNISMYYIIVTFLGSNKMEKIPFFVPFIISFFGILITFLVSEIPYSLLITVLATTFILIIIKQLIWKYFTDYFLNHLLLLVLLSVFSSVVISSAYKEKEDNYQQFIARTLSITNDLAFENSYEKTIKDILNDTLLQQMLTSEPDSADLLIENYLNAHYFKDYLDKYNIQITLCGTDELIEIQPEGNVYNCADYFNSMIEEITIPVIDSSLFLFNSGTESIYYISRITLSNHENDNENRNLFIEFVTSHVPEGLGYPELLIDKRLYALNLSGYSFAKYFDNHLTYKFGDFAYNTYFDLNKHSGVGSFFDYNAYQHFAVPISPNGYLIVSKETTKVTMQMVVFSVIFILLVLISITIYLIVYARKAFSLYRLNFKTRLQTFVIATLTITFILMAVSTLLYVEDNSRNDLEKQLTEKTNSVLIELQHKLSSISNFQGQDIEVLHQLLRKFSLVFFSDINLYDRSGSLIASSRPEIFEKGLLSTLINPKAYEAIFFDNKLNFITEESIGSLKYYSAYVPINLNNESPIGIVNLPYFARQVEFTKSYYTMLSYLINIYVIIGIIGALIAITFSRYLTRPLVLLQKSLATIRIDEHNEKIQWNKKDEIGSLINEYNLMVDKLEQSTYLLKHSERESAWREMAMQIAHEIKNPLTPMKLNIQYLEKSFKNNDPEFKSKIKSISQSLITQIDALNNVAEMFSNFAKTRSLDFEKVNLKKIAVSAVNLFNKNSNVSFSITYDDSDYFTLGFEKDIIRAVNNILKNAIQSVENDIAGVINVDLKYESNYISLAISDNGKGIPDKMKSKIFQPYFTTKTSGTGLGLAIVKNIMNEIGGDIRFESGKERGITFYLTFPQFN